MSADQERFQYLLVEYRHNRLDQAGWEELRALAQHAAIAPLLEEDFATAWGEAATYPGWTPAIGQEMWARISEELLRTPVSANTPVQASAPIRRLPTLRQWAAIAAAVLVLAGSTWLFLFPSFNTISPTVAVNDIPPGTNKATLTLANGRIITLDSAANTTISEQNNTSLIRLSNGQLSYHKSDISDQPSAIAYNVLSTPRGGQFSLSLADGTKAWLNAASSITYPTQFTGANREVTITGEVYFEIAANKAQPFIVKTNKQTVQVLGTHFNINAYDDEPAVSTTLLEGSIRVIAGTENAMVRPGEQAVYNQHQLIVSPADVDEAVAWKNGVFQFDNENLESIMRKLSRWYDVDIEYSNTDSRHIPFTGIITHFSNVSQVLRMLELTKKVHFTIEGKKIVVLKS